MKRLILALVLCSLLALPALATDDAPLSLRPTGPWIISLALSPDGATLMTISALAGQEGATDDRFIEAWDTRTGEPLLTLAHSGVPTAARFSPDGTLYVVGYTNGDISVHDAETLAETLRISGAYGGESYNFDISADNQWLVTSGRTPAVWSLEDGSLLLRADALAEWLRPVALSPDGVTVAALDGLAHRLHRFDLLTGEALGSADAPHEYPEYLAWLDDATLMVGKRAVLEVLDLSSETVLHRMTLERNGMNYLATHGKHALTGTFNGELILWDMAAGEIVTTLAEGFGRRGVSHVALVDGMAAAATERGVLLFPLDSTDEVMRQG